MELLAYQHDHVKKLQHILKRSWFAFDFSLLGLGKTYTSAFIAKDYDHVIVIAPLSVTTKWKQLKEDFKMTFVKHVGTFQSLRGKTFPYLSNLEPTAKLEKLFKEKKKVLLIIDEIQNLKNKSNQFLAAKTLIHEICQHGHQCKFLGLSASPFDKISHIEQLINLLGLNEENSCTMFPQVNLLQNKLMRHQHDKHLNNVFNTFVKELMPNFVSKMPITARDQKLHIYNAIYPLAGKNVHKNKIKLETNIKKMDELRLRSTREKNGGSGIQNLMKLNIYLHEIERAKVETMADTAHNNLLAFPNTKVVIMLNYTDDIEHAEKLLKEYNPLVITGKTSGKKRRTLLGLFQQHNTSHRLLIGNMKVLSTGIDLDDTHGDFPRFCIVSPNYNYLDLYQLNHRFLRAFTKSDSTIHYFFIEGHSEKRLLNNIARKKDVLKRLASDQVQAGIKLPGDFPVLHVKKNFWDIFF